MNFLQLKTAGYDMKCTSYALAVAIMLPYTVCVTNIEKLSRVVLLINLICSTQFSVFRNEADLTL